MYVQVSMDSTIQNLDSFFVNGFYKGHIDFIEPINFDGFTFTNHDAEQKSLDTNLLPIIEQVESYLKQNIVSKVFDKYRIEHFAWSGVDSYSSDWHNDNKEGFNSNILVYLDDSYGQNKIEIKNQAEEFTVYHKKGDFVWINQDPKFLHKATHITGNRRVLSFELWT